MKLSTISDRPTWAETFIRAAKVFQDRSVIGTQVGAVIVRDRRVISNGYNGKPSGDPDILRLGTYELDEVHAEANAIAFAAREGIATGGADIYVTARPCIHCAKLIIQSGITSVFCTDKKAKNQEACPDGIDLLKKFNVRVILLHE